MGPVVTPDPPLTGSVMKPDPHLTGPVVTPFLYFYKGARAGGPGRGHLSGLDPATSGPSPGLAGSLLRPPSFMGCIRLAGRLAEVIPPKVAGWAERINGAYRKGVEGILQTAAEIKAARDDCDHGEWKQLIEGGLLHFKRSQVFNFLAIGRGAERFQKVHHDGLLPSDTNTLASLAKLSDARFTELLEAGAINPSMKLNEASAETRHERTISALVMPSATSDRLGSLSQDHQGLDRYGQYHYLSRNGFLLQIA